MPKQERFSVLRGTKILGLDIGEKYNGVAIVDGETGKLLMHEICSRERLIVNVEALSTEKIAIVGMEEFVLYPWAAKSQAWKTFDNIELIGICKYICEKKKIPYLMVKAVQSKKVYSKERLTRLGYTIPHDAHDHQRDALSVALYTRDRLVTDSKRIIRFT